MAMQQRERRPKRCEYNNKDEDYSPNTRMISWLIIYLFFLQVIKMKVFFSFVMSFAGKIY